MISTSQKLTGAGAFIRINVVIINPKYLVIIRDELWKRMLWPLIWNDFKEGSQMRGHKECFSWENKKTIIHTSCILLFRALSESTYKWKRPKYESHSSNSLLEGASYGYIVLGPSCETSLWKCFVAALSYWEIKDYRINSIDPVEAAHLSCLICIYAVCILFFVCFFLFCFG